MSDFFVWSHINNELRIRKNSKSIFLTGAQSKLYKYTHSIDGILKFFFIAVFHVVITCKQLPSLSNPSNTLSENFASKMSKTLNTGNRSHKLSNTLQTNVHVKVKFCLLLAMFCLALIHAVQVRPAYFYLFSYFYYFFFKWTL